MLKFTKEFFRSFSLPPAGEQELKFLVPQHRAAAMRSWLDTQFIPHPSHKDSRVCSIYFDTPGLASYEEKAASDYYKTKYRLRWYAGKDDRPLRVPAFLEIKEKDGAARRKLRVPLPHSPAELAATPLSSATFVDIFHRFFPGVSSLPAAGLRPVLELRYRRQRYGHALFSESFCLDTEISCTRAREGGEGALMRVLPYDVFEQKGMAVHPLPVLRPLPGFGARRSSISKYFLILQQLRAQTDCHDN